MNNILYGKYIVIVKNMINEVISILRYYEYGDDEIEKICKFIGCEKSEKYVITANSRGGIHSYTYEFFIKNLKPTLKFNELNIIPLLREFKLKRILKS